MEMLLIWERRAASSGLAATIEIMNEIFNQKD
jgi:hypothetical protein